MMSREVAIARSVPASFAAVGSRVVRPVRLARAAERLTATAPARARRRWPRPRPLRRLLDGRVNHSGGVHVLSDRGDGRPAGRLAGVHLRGGQGLAVVGDEPPVERLLLGSALGDFEPHGLLPASTCWPSWSADYESSIPLRAASAEERGEADDLVRVQIGVGAWSTPPRSNSHAVGDGAHCPPVD
jgi:hypothetical protein